MNRATEITIVLADDHPIVLRGLKALLETEIDLSVIAACANGIDALESIREFRPDIAVIDVTMPGLTGIQVVEAMRKEKLRTRVLLLTASLTDASVFDAVAAGVCGIILKEAAPEILVDSLRAVRNGKQLLPSDLISPAIARETERRSGEQHLTGTMTPREREVMMLVAEGLSNKEVGRRLGLSDGTVKVHLHNVYQKTGVVNRTALASLAVRYIQDNLIRDPGNS